MPEYSADLMEDIARLKDALGKAKESGSEPDLASLNDSSCTVFTQFRREYRKKLVGPEECAEVLTLLYEAKEAAPDTRGATINIGRIALILGDMPEALEYLPEHFQQYAPEKITVHYAYIEPREPFTEKAKKLNEKYEGQFNNSVLFRDCREVWEHDNLLERPVDGRRIGIVHVGGGLSDRIVEAIEERRFILYGNRALMDEIIEILPQRKYELVELSTEQEELSEKEKEEIGKTIGDKLRSGDFKRVEL
jgi:hypothetical protein